MELARSSLLRAAARIALALACVSAGVLVAAAPASASPSWIVIQNVLWNRCLDVNPFTWNSNPGSVSIYACHLGIQQRWYADWASWSTEIRTIGPPYGPSNKCLDAWPMAGAPNGYRVSTWDCNGGNQQQWRLEQAVPGSSGNGFVLINVRFGLCLDTTWDTAAVGLYACHRNVNQRWTKVIEGT